MAKAKFQDLSLFIVPENFRGRSAFIVQLWWLVQASLFGLSPQPFYAWRAFLLRCFGARVGKGVKIRASARFTYPWKVEIGAYSWVGDRAEFYSLEHILVEDNVCISQDCYLCSGSHDHESVDFSYACAHIHIESESWLAAGCFVGPGVVVGRGAVVGARSVIIHNLDSSSVYVGNPARRIGERRVVANVSSGAP